MSGLIAELEAELEAALAELTPIVDGERDYLAVSITEQLKVDVGQDLVVTERRQGLLQNAIRALEALVADGYPDLPPSVLPTEQYEEFQGQQRDFRSVEARFKPEMAASLGIRLGEPTDKPPQTEEKK